MNDLDKILDDCLDIEEGLSDWEVDFLESLANQRKENGAITKNNWLSDKQEKKLIMIHSAKAM
jgi:hypothetical protein